MLVPMGSAFDPSDGPLGGHGRRGSSSSASRSRRRWDLGPLIAFAASTLLAACTLDEVEPPPPASSSTATAAELVAMGQGTPRTRISVLVGDFPDDRLPEDLVPFRARFTRDGGALVYVTNEEQMVSADVGTGDVRTITRCVSPCDVSPDGDRLAQASRTGSGLTIRDLASGEESTILTGMSGPVVPTWSPDGDWISVVDSRGILVIGSDGGGMRRLAVFKRPLGPISAPSWAPDGRTLAFVDSRGPHTGQWRFTLTTIAVDGSGRRDLRRLGRCLCLGMTPPVVSWSPDGDVIAFTTVRGTGDDSAMPGDVWLIKPDGTNPQRVGPSSYNIVLVWRPAAP